MIDQQPRVSAVYAIDASPGLFRHEVVMFVRPQVELVPHQSIRPR